MNEVGRLAGRYLMHLAYGQELDRSELAEAEKAYVLWDWDGLAALAYEQFLQSGRGALVGPRIVNEDDSVTVIFDYVHTGASLTRILDPSTVWRLETYLNHYRPEFEVVVVWLRPDGTATCELLESDNSAGMRAPGELYAASHSHRTKPN